MFDRRHACLGCTTLSAMLHGIMLMGGKIRCLVDCIDPSSFYAIDPAFRALVPNQFFTAKDVTPFPWAYPVDRCRIANLCGVPSSIQFHDPPMNTVKGEHRQEHRQGPEQADPGIPSGSQGLHHRYQRTCHNDHQINPQ